MRNVKVVLAVEVALGLILALAGSAPTLATIRDTLYNTDGSLFNGSLLIEWLTFETTAQVIDGALRVRLTPSATGTSYAVSYISDGEIQFRETWAVPATSAVLRLRDVRVATVGAHAPQFSDGETPAGTIDGTNPVFTLAETPSPAGSLALYRNGLLQQADGDYTLDGKTITFVSGSIPQAGDTLAASYRGWF